MAEVRWRMEPYDETADVATPGNVEDCTGADDETEPDEDGA